MFNQKPTGTQENPLLKDKPYTEEDYNRNGRATLDHFGYCPSREDHDAWLGDRASFGSTSWRPNN